MREPGDLSAAYLWALALRIVVLAVAVGLGLWLAVVLRDILIQVLLAVILAAGLGPLVDRLQALGVPRGPAVLLIYLGLILLLIVFGVAVIPPILDEIERVAREAPAYADALQGFLRQLRESYPFLPPLDEHLTDQLRGLGSQLSLLASQALSVTRLLIRVFAGALNGIMVLLLTLYLVVDGVRIREYLLSFLEPAQAARVRQVADRMGPRLGGWLLGQVTLSFTVGLLSFVGLSLLGVPGAVLLAVIAGIGEVIPIIGPIAAAVPAVFVALLQSPLLGLLTLGLYVLIQQLENNLLVPKIMERAVNLHPLAVVLALLVGSELLGVAGALVAVPVTAALAVILDEVRAARAAPAEPPSPAPLPAVPAPVQQDSGTAPRESA